jgi:DNA-binding SARP family transcriptional activator
MPQDRRPHRKRRNLNWRLTLLGEARLEQDGQRPEVLERRTAALLAYLAFEGPVTRSRIAGLLWPDSTESTARANLRQRFKRLRDALGTELILTTDQALRLRPDIEVDAVNLESLCFTGEFEAVLRWSGPALAGHDYDDLPDLEAWVLAMRERLENARREALIGLADQAETVHRYGEAAERLERLFELDPVSETLYRRAMRLHHLAGDRGAALRLFERCRSALKSELGVAPLPETLELARLIARGSGLPAPATPEKSQIPLSLLRPPVLVGRAAAWATLEAAWTARQAIFISGPPGAGKTRLLLDFAASKGAFVRLEGRPGDASVPYATQARGFRRVLEDHPDLALKPWVRCELSRLKPDLAADAPPAITSEQDKLRFYEAVAEALLSVAARGANSVLLDDLQFMDAGSFEMSQFFVPKSLSEAGVWPRALSAFRSGELPPEFAAQLAGMVDAGAAALIELEPLESDSVTEMLIGMEVGGLERLAAPLTRYTGGNPLFIVETLKHLFETDQLSGAFPERLPPPGQVGRLIRRRLERLSPGALRLAQVVAVAGTDFGLELGARVLEVNVFNLTSTVGELEAAQVMRGDAFAHDLISEAALQGLPNTIRALLHGRIAQHLETQDLETLGLKTRRAAPARVAHHWLGANQPDRATPHLMRAATDAAAAYRFEEAIAFNLRAADLLEASGQLASAFERVAAAQSWAQTLGSAELIQNLLKRLERTATTPTQRGYARLGRAQTVFDAGEMVAAERLTREARAAVRDTDDLLLRGELSALLGAILWMQGRFTDCGPLFEEAANLSEQRGDITNVTINLTNLAALEMTLLQHRQAIATFQRALKALEVKDDLVVRTGLLNNLATTQMQMGQGRVAKATLLRSKALLDEMPDVLERQLTCLYQLGACELQLGEHRDAIRHFERVLELAPASEAHVRPSAERNLALIALICGRDTEAETWLERAMRANGARPDAKVSMLVVRGLIAERRGFNPLEHFDAAEGLGVQHPLVPIALSLWRCIAVPPGEALRLATDALERTRASELFGAQVMAHTRLAQALLSLGRSAEALEQSTCAMGLLSQYDALPLGFQQGEVWLTHARALEANTHPQRREHLERSLAAILKIANEHVSLEDRGSFLTRNPTNAAITRAARAAGLNIPN